MGILERISGISDATAFMLLSFVRHNYSVCVEKAGLDVINALLSRCIVSGLRK